MRDLRTEEEIIRSWTTASDVPVVSVCCITFNHEKYIEEAIVSFLEQKTEFPIEILIHDDASTDRTAEIIKKYTQSYPSLIKPVLQDENQYSKGFNINPIFNYSRAKGDYIAICEGDDYWPDRKKLQKQVDFLNANSDYVIVYTNSQAFDESGPLNLNYGGATHDLSAFDLETVRAISTLTACFRNVFRNRAWPRDLMSSPYGDLATWAILGEYGKGKYMDNIEPSMYRVHKNGIDSLKSLRNRQLRSIATLAKICVYKENNDDVLQKLLVKLVFNSLQVLGPMRSLHVVWHTLGRSINKIFRRRH
jgi:glycosyltransferase involved in cell wall biosynthesis